MVKFLVWNPASNLYVAEAVPETGALILTSKSGKANPYVEADARSTLVYVNKITGMSFELMQV